MSRYIDPTTDFGFKKLFGNKANKEIITSFLTDVLELEAPILDIHLEDKEQLPEASGERRGIYDIYCTDRASNHFLVEMQKSAIAFVKDRLVYYSTFPISKQAPKVASYLRVAEATEASYGKNVKAKPWDYRLDSVYCIAVLCYTLDGSTKAVNRNSIRNDYPPYEVCYSKLKYITIELPLFDETKPECSLDKHLNKWLYFLKYLQAFDEMPEVFKGGEVFEKAFAIAELPNMTREERQRYEQSLKNQWDTYAMFTTAEQKGERRGERRGEQKALVKVAQALLQKGSDPALVAEVTGLALEQIQKLQNPGASVKKLYPTIE